MSAAQQEHEFKASIVEDVYYPAHPPRVETPTFRKTKHDGKARGDRCAITGVQDGLEYHHLFCEDALMDAVDWHTIRKIGTGEIVDYPVLDLETGEPTGERAPIKDLLIGMIVAITAARGFDWHAFDPTKPETFVDSPQNMLVIHEKFHRAPGHGIHHSSFPIWVFQSFPRVPGFVFMPDELEARHKKAVA